MNRYYAFEIRQEHVGLASYGKRSGGLSLVARFALLQTMGRILPGDVGKRAYWMSAPDSLTGTILQVENDEQRDARLSGGEEV